MNDRINWIKQIYPSFQEEEWMHEPVLKPSQIPFFDLYEYKKTDYKSSINPKDIKGIEYAYAYNSGQTPITWFDLLNELKRLEYVMFSFDNYDKVADHIHHNPECKAVEKYGNTLITIRGQHRLCLSKFLNIESVEVNIREHELNEEYFSNYQCLKNNINILNQFNLNIKSDKDILTLCKEESISLQVDEFTIHLNMSLLPHFISIYKSRKTNRLTFLIYKIRRYLASHNILVTTPEDLKKYSFLVIANKNKPIYKK